MSGNLQTTRAKLIDAWQAIPDHPPADQVGELVRRTEALVHLVGWIDSRPTATRAEYQAELARVRRSGVEWPEIRVISSDPMEAAP